MDRLSSILPKVLNKRGLKGQADASLMVHVANEWIRKQSLPASITANVYKENVLFISVSTSIDAQECHARSEELKEHLSQQFPFQEIKSVRILRERCPVDERMS